MTEIKNTSKNVRLSTETTDRLDAMRHRGQSYNGIINELIDYYRKNRKQKVVESKD